MRMSIPIPIRPHKVRGPTPSEIHSEGAGRRGCQDAGTLKPRIDPFPVGHKARPYEAIATPQAGAGFIPARIPGGFFPKTIAKWLR